LVNANNKMVPDDYPYLITAHWQDAYRANRISQLLSETETSTVKSTEAVQQDIVSLMAREILPLLVGHAGKIPAADKPLVDALARWDGSADRMRWEPLMFALWVENTKRHLLADELGDLYREFGGTHPDVLARILNGADPRWCDD